MIANLASPNKLYKEIGVDTQLKIMCAQCGFKQPACHQTSDTPLLSCFCPPITRWQ